MTAHGIIATPPVQGSGREPPGLPHRPACMTGGELVGWSETNALFGGSLRPASPCEDCTLAFAEEMRVEGHCNGMPAERALSRPV
ncbi:MAG: hypothetical protein ACLQBX_17835 [Candidatus Limnocylindrales bacterium]|jgi:hypothetical protein